MKDYSVLIDVLTNSMDKLTAGEFIAICCGNDVNNTNFVSFNQMWDAYWELDGMARFEYTDSDWNNFISAYVE